MHHVGKGIIEEAAVKGVRGTIDFSHVHYAEDAKPTPLRQATKNDFQLAKFNLEDLYLTILYPDFRPYTVSIFSMDCDRFRQQWLLWDVLGAETLVGMYDDCLFSIHTPQATMEQQRNAKLKWSRPVLFPSSAISRTKTEAGVVVALQD